jgi:hypothetical protein
VWNKKEWDDEKGTFIPLLRDMITDLIQMKKNAEDQQDIINLQINQRYTINNSTRKVRVEVGESKKEVIITIKDR